MDLSENGAPQNPMIHEFKLPHQNGNFGKYGIPAHPTLHKTLKAYHKNPLQASSTVYIYISLSLNYCGAPVYHKDWPGGTKLVDLGNCTTGRPLQGCPFFALVHIAGYM